MKKQLLFSAILGIAFTLTTSAQNKVWDFGNDTTNWPLNPTALTTTTVVDELTLEPGGGSGFGIVEGNSATWFSGTANEYSSINRFKVGGNSGIDPSGGSAFTPTRRYLSFAVNGAVSIKIWFRPGGTSARSLYITNGSETIAYLDCEGDTDPKYLEMNYTGSAGIIYLVSAVNAFNLYKIEVNENLLGVKNASLVSTTLKAVGSKVYVSNVLSKTDISVYSLTGALVKSISTTSDMDFDFRSGLYIVKIETDEGLKTVKVLLK